jgi:hypothetical protein
MTIRRWATDPDYAHLNFEKPIPLGDNSVGFDEAGVDSWLAERAAKRDDVAARVAAEKALWMSNRTTRALADRARH